MPHDAVDELLVELRTARDGPTDVYAAVLERAVDLCAADPAAAEEFDDLELHDELVEAYDRLDRVEEALAHADVLVCVRPIRGAGARSSSCGMGRWTRTQAAGTRSPRTPRTTYGSTPTRG